MGRVGVSGGERLSGFARGRDGAAKRASRGRASGSRTSSGSPLYAAGSGSASAANGASLPRARRARSASSSAPRRASRRGESARRPPPSPRTRPSRRDARATTRGSATRAANVAARPIAIHLAGSRARDSTAVIVYPLRDPYTRRVSSNDGSDGIGYITRAPSSHAKHRALLRERLLVRALHHIRHVFPRRVSRQPLPVPVRERHPSRRSGRRRRRRRRVVGQSPRRRRRRAVGRSPRRRRHSRGHRGHRRHVRMIRPNGRRRRRRGDVDGVGFRRVRVVRRRLGGFHPRVFASRSLAVVPLFPRGRLPVRRHGFQRAVPRRRLGRASEISLLHGCVRRVREPRRYPGVPSRRRRRLAPLAKRDLFAEVMLLLLKLQVCHHLLAEPRVLRGRHAHARVRRREGGSDEGSDEGVRMRRESQTRRRPPLVSPGRGRVGRFRLAAHRASNPSHGLVQIARDGGGDIFEVRRGGGGGDVVAEKRRVPGRGPGPGRTTAAMGGSASRSFSARASVASASASARATASAFSWSSRNISPLAASFSRASRNRSRVSSISSLSFAVSSASTSRRRASSRRKPSAGSAPSATYRSHSSANARFAASADSARNARSSASRRSRATSDVHASSLLGPRAARAEDASSEEDAAAAAVSSACARRYSCAILAVAARLAAALVASTSFSGPVSTSTGRVTALSTASFASNGGTPSRDARRLEGSTSRPTADAAVLAANAFVSSSETPGGGATGDAGGLSPPNTSARNDASSNSFGSGSGRGFGDAEPSAPSATGGALFRRMPRRGSSPSDAETLVRALAGDSDPTPARDEPRPGDRDRDAARAPRPGERDLDVDLDRFRGGAFAGEESQGGRSSIGTGDLARAGERERRAPGTIEPANAGSVVLPYAPPE